MFKETISGGNLYFKKKETSAGVIAAAKEKNIESITTSAKVRIPRLYTKLSDYENLKTA